MADVKFYYDPLSQPCRTVMLLLAAGGVKREDCLVQILKGELKTNEGFLKASASGTVPVIDDNGFHLFESVAIMKYLISKYNLPDNWYPSDLKQRARIDEYLNWHSLGMRRGSATYFVSKWLSPNFMGRPVNTEKIEEARKTLQSAFKMMEEHYLKETKFVNSDQISIADLLAVCELTQLWMTDEDSILSDRPRITQWISDVQSVLSPHFDEVHKWVLLQKKEKTFLSKK